MTDPEDGLPESVKRAAIDCAKEKSEYARISRINQADNDVRSFNKSHSQKDFWKEWSERIVTLGQVLKTEKWDRHLDSIQFDTTDEVRRDAFNYAVQIFQAAVSGDVDKVLTRLKYLSKAATSGDENEREEMEKFCNVVNEALRCDIMSKLRKKEYSIQNQTQYTSNTQNQVEAHFTSGDHSDLESSDGQNTIKPGKKKGRPKKGEENEWLGKAIVALRDNPGWSDSEIADYVDISRSTLSRSAEWKKIRKLQASGNPIKGGMMKGKDGVTYVDGHVYDDNGD
ncbi:hypothetical protein Mal35_54850 [Gimesia maris]|uniref:helix-turn-helix domain-containing protein n=1 Tax=Gimesia maris TaxID=122 RepID=UPI00118B4011|nr:helix-turn-helix transcriptional regulator [Gimesia maris]QDT81994.1 hypothetical protein Mal35_54850 [Gimesia maris]